MSQRNFLLEGVSAFFVNGYFHQVYDEAKSNRKGSLTESYQEKVANYIRGIKSIEKIFRRLCTDIHRYICKSSRFSSMMYGEFIDKLVIHFTPPDYFEVLSRDQKDELFSSIINDLVATLGSFCLRPNILRKIIDEHDGSKAITQDILFREALSILSNKREELIHSFVKTISQSKDMISAEVAEKYKRMIEEANEENNRLKSEIVTLETELDEYEAKETKYRKIIELLQKNRITIEQTKTPHKITTEIAQQTEENPIQILTVDNLKRHLEDPKNKQKKTPTLLKDESGSDSSQEILSKARIQAKEKGSIKSLSSGKKSLIDNIDGLLLVDE